MRTKSRTGYGRPWTEEEFILSLDLYYRTEPKERDAGNREVLKLAHLTNRTPASIVYRLGNYSACDPDADTKGFDNGGKTVREMFDKHSPDRQLLRRRAGELKEKYAEKAKLHTGGIKEFVANFNDEIDTLEARLEECEKLRKKFLDKWPASRLDEILTLENYAIGHGDTDNFCYWVERETRILGSILGATASKFKVYYKRDTEEYKWVAGFGSAQQAFEVTKKEIINLLKAGEKGDLEAIKDNKFFKHSNMFRGKLLSLYYPMTFLSIGSEDDINFFLDRLGIEYDASEHIIDKQEKLLQYKASADDMSGWSNLKFAHFLYSQFTPPSKVTPKSFVPKNKDNKEKEEIIAEEGFYALPQVGLAEVSLVDFEEIAKGKRETSGRGKKRKYKPNYIAESIRNKKLGDQGEEIVLMYEKQVLVENKRKDLAEKVEWVSLEDDSRGYDIRSFTPDGKEKLIDVKATKSGINVNAPFYLTENERKTMKENKGKYYLYRVFGANTIYPKLLIIDGDLLDKKFDMRSKLWEVSAK